MAQLQYRWRCKKRGFYQLRRRKWIGGWDSWVILGTIARGADGVWWAEMKHQHRGWVCRRFEGVTLFQVKGIVYDCCANAHLPERA